MPPAQRGSPDGLKCQDAFAFFSFSYEPDDLSPGGLFQQILACVKIRDRHTQGFLLTGVTMWE